MSTYEIRNSMCNRLFASDLNHPIELTAKVLNVMRNGGGHTVMFSYGGGVPVYCALRKFQKRFPYEHRI
ncbi:TPA: hypothetical protein U5E34_002436 [Yersinia enterocolitica]|nr:hypothetical protein [Yersinia enterocolitica]HEN3621611.1 hypothetical protein [Yersinia enterocolitica]